MNRWGMGAQSSQKRTLSALCLCAAFSRLLKLISMCIIQLEKSGAQATDKGLTMTELMKEIEKQAESLSARERELLAERLLATLRDVPLTEIDLAWLEEAERRYRLLKEGQTEGIEAEHALEAIRRELRQ